MPTQPPQLTRSSLTPVLTHVLTTLTQTNTPHFPPPHPTHPHSLFYSIRPPTIPLPTYIHHLTHHAPCPTSTFIIALVYLDRLQKAHPKLMITSLNIHRLLVTSIVLAGKWLDDGKGAWGGLGYWARVGGIGSVDELRRLELQVLKCLKWEVFVGVRVYRVYERSLKERVCGLEREKGFLVVRIKREKEKGKMERKRMGKRMGVTRSRSLDDNRFVARGGLKYGFEKMVRTAIEPPVA